MSNILKNNKTPFETSQDVINLEYKSIIDLSIIPENLVISTMTIICYFNTAFNAENIYEYVNLDKDNIISVKYRGKIRTVVEKKKKKKRKQKKEFFNQITLIVNTINNKEINCKLFKNGSIQVTGCKNISHFVIAIKKICKAFKDNDNAEINLEKNPLFVEEKPFYQNKYTLNYYYNNENKLNNNMLTILKNKLKKNMIEFEEIFIKNKADLKKKKIDKYISVFPKLYAANNSNLKYGDKYKGELSNKPKNIDKIFNFIRKYIDKCKSTEILNINTVKEFKIVMINSNFNIGFEINRAMLYEIMQKLDITSSFEPCTHACVNIKYIYKKGTPFEKKISIFVFESGSIIITGANNTEHILEGYKFINNILKKYKNDIILQDANDYINHPELMKILNKNL